MIIAIINSGVDIAHPDFAGRLWTNDDPVNGVDDDLNGKVDDEHGWNVYANSADLADPNGHGTEVGGVAGAASDNGVGVAGLCWSCQLMFVSAIQATGVADYSDVAAAVQYAGSNGAQVINLSLSGYADSAALRDAIREAAVAAMVVAGAVAAQVVNIRASFLHAPVVAHLRLSLRSEVAAVAQISHTSTFGARVWYNVFSFSGGSNRVHCSYRNGGCSFFAPSALAL